MDVTNYASADVNVPVPIKLLERVKDDSDNDIGCIVGYHTDANNQKYAVVCLNKYYRPSAKKQWLSSNVLVTGLPEMDTMGTIMCSTDTATSNCDKILSFASANNLTSDAVNECRALSFVIDGVTYHGQLPNYMETLIILGNYQNINTADPSTSGGFDILPNYSMNFWTSTQNTANYAWAETNVAYNGNNSKTYSFYVFPILEIPIA